MHARLRGLYAITPDCADTTHLLSLVKEALQGGINILQYRDKIRSREEQKIVASELKLLCNEFNTLLIINDDVRLALEVEADGVHLGGTDGDLRLAKALLGPTKILGASCYDKIELAETALADGADYVAFGAVFGSQTKPNAPRASLALFSNFKQISSAPCCAIGGITADNASQVINAGADMVAVISDLFSSADITSKAHRYQQLFYGETL